MKHEIIAQRMSLALSKAGISQQELSERSGVLKSSISQYVNGSHVPSSFNSGKMAEVLDVSPVWLMGFDVPMNDAPLESVNLSPEEAALIKLYRIAPELLRETVWNVLRPVGKNTESAEEMAN